jgi:hypothetical protein
MRRATALAVLLCAAHAGPPEEQAPICRCALAAKPAGLKTVGATGLAELDQRLKSESNFLKQLYGVEAELILLAAGAERPVFAAPNAVAFAADWMRLRWQAQDDRAATVAFWVAHQWAHVLQQQRGCKLPEISRELHADLLAGWFLGRRNFATLGSGPELNPAFARSLFAEEGAFANERFEHGRAIDRAEAVMNGFRLFRKDKLALDRIYAEGLKLYPPPQIGSADDVSGPPAGAYTTVKVECTHRGPCHHRAPCTHQGPCVHKTSCKHEAPCEHQVTCTHRVPCEHQVPCVHKVKCRHRIACVHTVPCRHRMHECDYLHDSDVDYKGDRVRCTHSIPCTHFLHSVDFLHLYDLEHEYDLAHDFDRQHRYDLAHDFDLKHKFDRPHDFDPAHDWDPVHEFDPAHEWDPLHAYDVRYVPVAEAEGASGAK